jgi:hypothetical protein
MCSSIEGMSTPGERLSVHKLVSRTSGGDGETTYRSTPQAAQVDCAIEITEALIGLKTAVNDMANRSVTVMSRLIEGIDKATKQAEASSTDSANLAAESAKLSRKLNMLTIWIVIAAIISAGAAGVQAWAAWYNVHHPQQPAVLVSSPPVPASPPTPAH